MSVDQIGNYHLLETSAEEGDFYVSYLLEDIRTKMKYTGFLIHRKKLLYSPYIQKLHKILDIQASFGFPMMQNVIEVITDEELQLIVFDYKYKSLMQLFTNGETLFETQVRQIFAEMAIIVHHLHKKHVAILDIQPNSFFLTQTGILKIGVLTSAGLYEPNELTEELPGSVNYAAPEVFKGPFDPFAADIWSLGMTLYALLLGDCPINGQSVEEIQEKIKEMKEVKLPSYFSPTVTSLLRHMLQLNPKDRMTIEDVMEHPFVTSTIVTKSIMLKNDLEKTASRILQYASMKSIKCRKIRENLYSFNFTSGSVFRSQIRLETEDSNPVLRLDVFVCENQADLNDLIDAFQYLLGTK